MKKVEGKWSLTPKEAAELIRKNLDVEDFAGEEYTSALAMSALKLISEEESDKSVNFLKEVFDEISREEEYHLRILEKTIESLEENH